MCVFNDLDSFSVVDNIVVDVMHDIFEGICHIEIGKILNYFIYDRQFFTLTTLNKNMNIFAHNKIENTHRAPDITPDKKCSFKMSASEMMSFVHLLPLIIGEYVPRNDVIWKFMIILLELIEFILKPSFLDTEIVYLRSLIKKHHETYIKLFNSLLTPKQHFIIHYPQVIKKFGPLKPLWTMRFEAKHKELISYANVITSRKNIALSIGKKIELSLNLNCYQRSNENCTNYKMGQGEFIDVSKFIISNSIICSDDLKQIYGSTDIIVNNRYFI